MLSILREKEKYDAPCALLLGGFDGLHIGHKRLLEEAKKTGLSVGLTSILGCKSGGDIFTFSEREILFERAGFSFVFEIDFNERFQNISAEEFLYTIFEKFPVRALFCGEDFRFGRGACGTPTLIKTLAPCPLTVLPLEKEGNEKISATRLKRLIEEGRIKELNELLAFPYFIEGQVERGRQVGRKIGFPTANLSFERGKLPLKEGVYGGRVEANGASYSAIINVGARPTFGVEERKTEAHLKDFCGDLYGKRIRVFPEVYLRPVATFDTEQKLVLQLKKDKREWFHD